MKEVVLILRKLQIGQECTSQVSTRRICFEHHSRPQFNLSKEKERHSSIKEQSHHSYSQKNETEFKAGNCAECESLLASAIVVDRGSRELLPCWEKKTEPAPHEMGSLSGAPS